MRADIIAGLVSASNTAKASEQAGQQAKRDMQSSANAGQYSIPVHHKNKLSYQQFVQDFMQPNLPVMIQASLRI